MDVVDLALLVHAYTAVHCREFGHHREDSGKQGNHILGARCLAAFAQEL